MALLREIGRSLRAAPVFALAVLVTLVLAGFNGSMVVLMNLPGGAPGGFGQMTHFQEPHHRTHDLTFGFLFVPAVFGMLAQLRRPAKNVAGQLMALIPWVGLVLTLVLTFVLANNTNVYGPQWQGVSVATLIATILHPTWRDFFRSFSVSRVNWGMLALVVIAAVPLLVFASTNIGLQGTVSDDHALMGHYGFMAAFGFTVIGVGLLASLRPDGWWLPAWMAGLLPALLGLTSLLYPEASSSLGLVWALAAIAWGAVFVAAAELTQDAENPTLLGSLLGSRGVLSKDDTGVRPTEDRSPGTPRWVNVFGGIALVVVLLVVVPRWIAIAGGPGLHGPEMHGPRGDAGGNTPPIAGAPELAITANAMAFGPDRIELTAGEPVNVALTSVDILHDLVVDEIGFYLAADRNETVTGGLVFAEPGIYVGYCSVPGHREAGMELEIVVTPSDGADDHTPPVQH